jgi:hypothetical protein
MGIFKAVQDRDGGALVGLNGKWGILKIEAERFFVFAGSGMRLLSRLLAHPETPARRQPAGEVKGVASAELYSRGIPSRGGWYGRQFTDHDHSSLFAARAAGKIDAGDF